MDESNRAKLILLGLFIIGVLLGFFLFQRIIASRTESSKTIAQIASIRPTFASPLPSVSHLPTPSPTPMVLGQAKKLPSTGVEEDLLAVFAIAIIIAGFSLRKFPN